MAAIGAFLVEAGKQILIAIGIDVGRDIADKGREKEDEKMSREEALQKLVGQSIGLISHLFSNNQQVTDYIERELHNAPDSQWHYLLSYFDSDKGRDHLQAMRESTDDLLNQ